MEQDIKKAKGCEEILIVRSGLLIRRMGGKINENQKKWRDRVWPSDDATREERGWENQSRANADRVQYSWISTTPILGPVTKRSFSYQSNEPLCIFIGESKKDPTLCLHSSHMLECCCGGNFPILSQSNCSQWFPSPSSTPFDDNGGWRDGHLVVIRHRSDEHMEEAVSLLSSTDQLSTWELWLPGLPSKLSPGCLWVPSSCHLPLTWVPSRNPGEKKKKKTP